MTNLSLTPDTAPGEQVRPWAIAPLFIAQALVMGATTVGTILASMIMGHMGLPSLVGLPVTLISIAGAFSAGYFGSLMMNKGRRFGLGLAFILGGIGSIIGFFGGQSKSLVVFLIGAGLVGIAQGGYFQARYALIESVPEAKRGSLLGLFMLAGVAGSFAISGFSGPIGNMAQAMGTTFEVGGWLIGGIMLLFSAGLLMLWKPTKPPSSGGAEKLPLAKAIQIPGVRSTAMAIALSQAVMLALMALLPIQAEAIHVHEKSIALMISGHIMGMYGLAWFTGPLIDRMGTPFAYVAGTVLLVVAAITAPLPGAFWVAFSFFVLGLGWNFAYMAGSKAMARFPSAQGVADGLGYLLSAIFTLGGGVLIAATNFATMSFVAGLLSLPILYSAWRARVHEQMVDSAELQPSMPTSPQTPISAQPQPQLQPQQPYPTPIPQSQSMGAGQTLAQSTQATQHQSQMAMQSFSEFAQPHQGELKLAAAPVISSSDGQLEYKKPVITEFSVQPMQVSGQEPVIIRWSTRNAQKVVIAGIGDVPLSGTCTIQPIDSIEVNLTAHNDTLTACRTQHLVILPPHIKTFELKRLNQEMVLIWEVVHAAFVEVNGLGAVPSKGQYRLKAQHNAQFTIIAVSVDGKSVKQTIDEADMALPASQPAHQLGVDHRSPSANLVNGLDDSRNKNDVAEPEVDALYAATQPHIDSFTVQRSGNTSAILAWRVSNIDRVSIDGVPGPHDDETWPPHGRIRVKVKSGKIFTLRAGDVVQARSLVMPSAMAQGKEPERRVSNGASNRQQENREPEPHVSELKQGTVLSLQEVKPIGPNRTLVQADFTGACQDPKGKLYISEVDNNNNKYAKGLFTSETTGMDQVPVDIVCNGNNITLSTMSATHPSLVSAKRF